MYNNQGAVGADTCIASGASIPREAFVLAMPFDESNIWDFLALTNFVDEGSRRRSVGCAHVVFTA